MGGGTNPVLRVQIDHPKRADLAGFGLPQNWAVQTDPLYNVFCRCPGVEDVAHLSQNKQKYLKKKFPNNNHDITCIDF